MAQKKGGKGQSEDPEELSRTPLQAILLADTFNLKFRPITLERPKVLLPLVNTPMIEYTLSWLESADIEEVFIFCCSHAEQVTQYIKNSRWGKNPKSFLVNCIESNFSISAGDALRFIEEKNVIRGDFILITGDTITNMNITEALNIHKERRKKDPDTIMTMFVKKSKPNNLTHLTRLGNDEIMMAIDSDTKQLLYYEDKCEDNKKVVTLDKHLVKEHNSICLHNDLEDCYIDICSPEMLTILLDNFDYQHLRRHFVKGLLLDDIMGKKIYTHEIESSYAARVDNLRSYDTISKDIIQRWPFPFVPDTLYIGNRAEMKLGRQGIHKAPDVILSSSAKIGPNSAIGSCTIIGDNTNVLYSVIGESCIIGENVSIEGCYIWDNVTIEDDCQLKHAIVCDGVILRAGATLEPGVTLSFKVEVGKNIKIPAYSKVSLLPQPSKQDSDEELEYADSNTGVIDSPSIATISPSRKMHASFETEQLQEVGISGVGYIWTSSETGNEDDYWKYSIAPIAEEKLKELYETAIAGLDASFSEEEHSGITHSGEILNETKSAGFDSDADEYRGDSAKFEKEVEETFERALGGVAEENVKLEINSLRLSYNVSHAECAGALFQSVIKSALNASKSSNANLLKASTLESIEKWKGLLCHFIRTGDEEIEVIMKFEEMCMESTKEFSPIFSWVLHQLYDKEIISEDSILSWASEREGADESDKIFVKQSEAFLMWLKEAPEEDDEDE